MPLGEEPITSFFKRASRTSNNYKSSTSQVRDSAKRARNVQDGTDAKPETPRKKAKPSPTPQSRASGSGKLLSSPSGHQTLLTDLLQRKKGDAPKQSRSAKSKQNMPASVIDLTNNNEDGTEDAAIVSTNDRSAHHPKQSSMNSKRPRDLSSDPVGSTNTCPSYPFNELDKPSFGTTNIASGPSSGRLNPAHTFPSPRRHRDPTFFDAVPSSQSQDLERELLPEPTPSSSRHMPPPWYMSPSTGLPSSSPFTPKKPSKAVFPDVPSSPAVPSSQTQELYTFDSPTSVRTSPAVRSSQTQPLYLLDTPTSAHTSAIIASSQTQALCMFDTPTRRRTSPSQRRMLSDGDHEDIEIIPSSQAVEKEPSLFDSPSARNSQSQAYPADSKPMRSTGTGEAAIESSASPIPASESQSESYIRSTEYSPPATPSDAPRFTPPPESPPQEDHSQRSEDGNLADHSLPDSLPVFDSQPGLWLPDSQASDDPSGSMVISDFFNIFDEGGSSLPADFPIPLW